MSSSWAHRYDLKRQEDGRLSGTYSYSWEQHSNWGGINHHEERVMFHDLDAAILEAERTNVALWVDGELIAVIKKHVENNA